MKPFIHILHLEDNPADAELIQATLESADLTCQITRVQTRDEFSQALRQSRYDVIFADYRLPAYDGMSALRLSLERCPETPFIFISGTMGEDTAIEALTEGATDYVLKQKLSRLVPAVTRALREAENRKERKRAETELRDSGERLRLTMEAVNIGSWDWDVQHDIWHASPIYYTMLGYEPKAGQGDRNEWLKRVHPDDRAYVAGKIQGVLTRDFKEYRYEARLRHADGTYRWQYVHGFGIQCDEKGNVTRMLGIMMDITERKQAEEAQRRLNRELRAITNCNYVLMRAEDEQTLLNDICRIVCDEAGYCMAWVGYAEHDDAQTVRPVAWVGVKDGYLANANITWADTERGRGPTGTAIRTGESTCIQNFMTDSQAAPWRENALQRGYRSSLALPLKDEHATTFGALNIYSTEPNAFTPDEIRLMEELANDLAFGITVLRTRAERKRAEEALRESEKRVRRKLDAVLSPEADISALELSDIIDSEKIQKLMDEFYQLTNIGIGIIDLHGRVLVGTGWQDICTRFHRINPESCRLCIESDLELSRNVPTGTFKQYRCKNNMWDIATPIMLADKHMGNIFLGQFLFDDETPDYETFRQQAYRYGFDEQEYIAALDRVPGWSREMVNAAMSFYAAFAEMIGNLSYSNIKLANTLEERKRTEEILRQSEHRKTILNQIANIFLTVLDEEMYAEVLSVILQVLPSPFGFFGYIGETGDLIIPSLTGAIWKACQVPDKSFVFPSDTWGESLWGKAIRERKAFASDGPFHTPEGHVPIDHFLAVPVVSGQKTIGIISVANKAGGYTEADKELLEYIAAYVAPILHARLQRDVQERNRKRAEEALRESERLLAEIAANYPHSYLSIIEHDFTIGFTSGQEFTKQHLDPKSFEGLSLEQVFGEHTPTVREQYLKAFQGEETSFELFINNQHQLYNVVPLYNQHGHVARILAVVENITERKRTEEELTKHREHLEELVAERTAALEQEILERKHIEHALHEAKDAAEAASQAKSEFLANMSHELRTPLNAILGYAQLLKREKTLTERQRDQLNTMYSSGEYLLTLINDLLDLTRIEAQRIDVEVNIFNLPAFLRNILDVSRLKAEEGSLFVQYQELSPIPAMVKGDERKLRQVLLNLLDNAVKYTEHGGVTLRVRLLDGEMGRWGDGEMHSQTPSLPNSQTPSLPGSLAPHLPISPSPHLLFEVEDTGIGISDEQMQTIFEPFTRGDSRPTEGIGLGLAICRRLIDLMEGRLSVTSEVGKGSTFTVELELEGAEAGAGAANAPENAIMGYHGERKHLLIVDDNITNLAMLVATLEPLGFAIETAESGEETIHKAAATRPDLILLDLLMPGMDGDEVLRQIRQDVNLRKIKVIGVSAAVVDKARVTAFAAACDAFMAKPVDIRQLQEQLKEQLQIKWIEEKTEAATAPASAKLSPVDADKPEKWPPQPVVDDLLDKVEWGDFTRLETILDRLEDEDNEYKGFCETIRAHARRFDDDAIINYLS